MPKKIMSLFITLKLLFFIAGCNTQSQQKDHTLEREIVYIPTEKDRTPADTHPIKDFFGWIASITGAITGTYSVYTLVTQKQEKKERTYKKQLKKSRYEEALAQYYPQCSQYLDSGKPVLAAILNSQALTGTYEENVRTLTWYIHCKANLEWIQETKNKHPFIAHMYLIEDENSFIYNFLISNNLYYYNRDEFGSSTHYQSIRKNALGLDLDNLPDGKKHILFGQLDPNETGYKTQPQTYIKMENHGIKKLTDRVLHGKDWAITRFYHEKGAPKEKPSKEDKDNWDEFIDNMNGLTQTEKNKYKDEFAQKGWFLLHQLAETYPNIKNSEPYQAHLEPKMGNEFYITKEKLKEWIK